MPINEIKAFSLNRQATVLQLIKKIYNFLLVINKNDFSVPNQWNFWFSYSDSRNFNFFHAWLIKWTIFFFGVQSVKFWFFFSFFYSDKQKSQFFCAWSAKFGIFAEPLWQNSRYFPAWSTKFVIFLCNRQNSWFFFSLINNLEDFSMFNQQNLQFFQVSLTKFCFFFLYTINEIHNSWLSGEIFNFLVWSWQISRFYPANYRQKL